MRTYGFRVAFIATAAVALNVEKPFAGPLDDIRNGLQILDTLDRLNKRNRNRSPSSSDQRQDRRTGEDTRRQEWRAIQGRLNDLGFPAGKVDGKPGRQTMNAIAAFQAANGLEVDGKIGPSTREILFSDQARAAGLSSSGIVQTEVSGTSPGSGSPAGADSGPSPVKPVSSGRTAYYGYTQCKKEKVTFLLELRQSNSGYSADLFHIYRWSQSGFHKYESLIGEYRAENDVIALVRDGKQLHAVDWLGNKIIEVQNSNQPTFKINGSECKTGTLVPITNDEEIPAPPGGGTFFQATTPRDRCEALVSWLEQSNQVYDAKVPGGSRNYAKMYVDDFFVPVFGLPYDRLSYNQIKNNFRVNPGSRNHDCFDEPFVRERWRGVYQIHSQGFVSFEHHKYYIDWYVRRNRNIGTEIERAISAAPDIYKIATVAGLVDKEDAEEFLSPQKISAIEARLRLAKEGRAAVDKAQYISDLKSKNAETQIIRAQELDKQKPPFFEHLSKPDQLKFEESVKAVYVTALDQSLQPVLLEIQALPQDLEGLKQARQILRASSMAKVDISKQRDNVVTKINAEIGNLQNIVSSTFESQLQSFSADSRGLAESIQWRRGFEQNVKPHLPEQQVSATLSKWDAGRDKLLEGAISAFETEAGSVEPGQIDALVANYISREFDADRPIILEYELIAQSYQ